MSDLKKSLKNYKNGGAVNGFNYKILVIDDERAILKWIKLYFSRKYKYEVLTVNNALDGMEILKTNDIHCVILDIKMDEMDGFDAYPKLKEIKPDVPIVFYSAFQNEHDLKTILNEYQPAGYFTKGKDIEGLESTIKISIEKYLDVIKKKKVFIELKDSLTGERVKKSHLQKRLQTNYQFDTLIGYSQPMLEFKKICQKAVNSDITVLIEGETGTGKELIANIVHENSSRCNKGFFIQNCAAIPENLFESELFGHRKGSFSGAIGDKKGIFEMADQGTVFLDEVGEIPLSMQAKLLRLLQQGEIRPIGANNTIHVDVRIISATNRDLAAEVKSGNFREDLYFRLNVFKLSPPPLRKILDNIPILVKHFIRKYQTKHHSSAVKISEEALTVLMHYSFPGNVRELENEIERAIVMVGTESDTIEPIHLSENLLTSVQVVKQINNRKKTMKEQVESFEQDLILSALDKHKGNKTHAASALGISRVGLNNKIKRYQLV